MSFEQDLIDAVRRKNGLTPEGTFKQEYSSTTYTSSSIYTRQWLDSIDRTTWPTLIKDPVASDSDIDAPDYIKVPATCLPHTKYLIHWHEKRRSWVLRIKNIPRLQATNAFRPLLVFENHNDYTNLVSMMSNLHNETIVANKFWDNCTELGSFTERWTGYGCIDIDDIGGILGYQKLIIFENADGRIMPVLCNTKKWQEVKSLAQPQLILQC